MIFGADYYPEQWTRKDWKEDISIMKEMGLSSVRLAEFAWAMMEPKEGKYDFSFFDHILSLIQKNEMTAILGTPTATFPPWLAKKISRHNPGKRWNSKDNWHQKTGLFFFT